MYAQGMRRNPVHFYGPDPYYSSSVRDALVYAHGWGMAEATRAVKDKWGRVVNRSKRQGLTPQQTADEIVRLVALREDDHVQEIHSALETAVEEMADEGGATTWSTGDDATGECVERKGFDPDSAVIIASFGDAYAVDGDILVPPHWDRELGLDPAPHPMSWAERSKGKYHAAAILEDWLRDHGYDLVSCGGRVPSAEEHVSGEFAIEHVAREMNLPVEQVADAAEALEWWDEEIPWSTHGDTDVWAKKKDATDDQDDD